MQFGPAGLWGTQETWVLTDGAQARPSDAVETRCSLMSGRRESVAERIDTAKKIQRVIVICLRARVRCGKYEDLNQRGEFQLRMAERVGAPTRACH
jgi:hypothetical protein